MKPVSVIVPCYNMEAYLLETLQSVVASDYAPLEVIVVDDGSTDGSAAMAEAFAREHTMVKVIRQPNQGVSAARNNAIRHAKGDYILPVDADNLITSDYVRLAAEVLDARPDVLVVAGEADFFGDRTGPWHQPPFSLRLLARKNMIDTCAMFRRSDWERVGGYDAVFPFREDWTFWLAIFADGGAFYRIPKTCFHYRFRKGSKRMKERALKRELVDHVNRRFPEFMQRQLRGPLHYHRSWSRFLNLFRTERVVGDCSHSKGICHTEESVIHSGRNTLYEQDGLVIKVFAKPGFVKALLYGWFIKSKARRSYEYAERLLSLGIATPQPVAYHEVRVCGLLCEAEYVCRKSVCDHTFNHLIANPAFPGRETILRSIGAFVARMHEAGVLHRDLSGGNILFDEAGHVEIVDLNRIRWCRHIPMQMGCCNFERLNIDREALTVMAKAYAEARGFDSQACVDYIISHRWWKHVKQGITNM